MKVLQETQRLILRQFTEDDAALLLELDSDPEVMRFIGPRQYTDLDGYRLQIRDRIVRHYGQGPGLGCWAILDKAGGEFLGWVFLRPAREHKMAEEIGFRDGELELGYRLRRCAWNKGIATEASQAVLSHALAQPGPVHVVAVALVGNLASTRVMEKVGLKKVRQVTLTGFDQPGVVYALDKV
jgi:RimJ/RimL family protein N-acetyltransferase